MNKQQRKIISEAIGALSAFTDADHCLEMGPAATRDAIDAARSVFEDMANEEGEKLDNMPEALRDGEKGAAMEEAKDALEMAAQELDSTHISDTPEEGWHDDVSEVIQSAIDSAESF